MHYSYNNQYPVSFEYLPDRIRMPDGTTRTDKATFTEEELSLAGWIIVNNPPDYDRSKTKLEWSIKEDNSYGWIVRGIPLEEKEQEVRTARNSRINAVMWRIYRYQRERRLGLETTDKIEELDSYMQALADITDQESFPWHIEWPIEPITSGYSSEGAR
jgi:hypothetical protein